MNRKPSSNAPAVGVAVIGAGTAVYGYGYAVPEMAFAYYAVAVIAAVIALVLFAGRKPPQNHRYYQ